MQSFRFGQIVFETGERRPALLSSQLPSGISVEDRAVARDQERLAKDEIPQLGERGQLRGRNRDVMADVAGVRTEFVHAAGYEPALDSVEWASSFIWPTRRWLANRTHGCFRRFYFVSACEQHHIHPRQTGSILVAAGLALNTLLRLREWKSSNRSIVMRFCAGRSFTRVVRVARVVQERDPSSLPEGWPRCSRIQSGRSLRNAGLPVTSNRIRGSLRVGDFSQKPIYGGLGMEIEDRPRSLPNTRLFR